jgi:hypothetical protein
MMEFVFSSPGFGKAPSPILELYGMGAVTQGIVTLIDYEYSYLNCQSCENDLVKQ